MGNMSYALASPGLMVNMSCALHNCMYGNCEGQVRLCDSARSVGSRFKARHPCQNQYHATLM
eukprot:5143591-Amphidinium_carterae.3